MIAALYAAAARRRREWYADRPHLRRRLRHPVISIGNIAAGGRGKTPFTASVVRLLLDMGERPAILSRGYARTAPDDGVVVVRDAIGMRSDIARAGDEPFMLARRLPGAIVAVSPDRYLAGRLAEHHLGATVHVLDDGFQHFQLDRDVDIVLVSGDDLTAQTFPAGRLREPADVLVAADAIVALDGARPGVPRGGVEGVEAGGPETAVFEVRRMTGPPVFDDALPRGTGGYFALAGIAEPQGFFATLRERGIAVAGTRTFRDHHPYAARDVAAVFAEAQAAGASAVVTTEKDYVRLLPLRPFRMPVGWVPLTMEPEPPELFRQWLVSSMAAARDIVLG
jgi:tetraacyldisaccharide 4'-kinase